VRSEMSLNFKGNVLITAIDHGVPSVSTASSLTLRDLLINNAPHPARTASNQVLLLMVSSRTTPRGIATVRLLRCLVW
jgi:hypothetical protein